MKAPALLLALAAVGVPMPLAANFPWRGDPSRIVGPTGSDKLALDRAAAKRARKAARRLAERAS